MRRPPVEYHGIAHRLDDDRLRVIDGWYADNGYGFAFNSVTKSVTGPANGPKVPGPSWRKTVGRCLGPVVGLVAKCN